MEEQKEVTTDARGHFFGVRHFNFCRFGTPVHFFLLFHHLFSVFRPRYIDRLDVELMLSLSSFRRLVVTKLVLWCIVPIVHYLGLPSETVVVLSEALRW